MKKKVFLFGILFLIFILPVLFAATNDTGLSDTQKVERARQCLENKTEEKGCDNLGIEEKIFSLLAVGACEGYLINSSSSNQCWPSSGCTIKSTAQAILALDKVGDNITEAETWLLEQKTTPSEIVWYLQIESTEATKCVISYSEGEYTINISEEKQINSGAGNCLSLSEGNWWLKIASSCYGKEIEISCDKKFLTNLLFQKEGSSTIHVSEKTTESSANGLNTEKVDSFCFGKNGVCDYEGSLWAAMVLDYTDNDVDSYMPYLITLYENENNEKYIPESFLYYLTNSADFRNNLLLKQKVSKYWEESGDRFYDTALALLPFSDEPKEKTNSKKWLLNDNTIDSDGCWKGSISATGFILFSLWPLNLNTGDCINGKTQNCTIGGCAGTKTCTNRKWGDCIKTNSSCVESCTTGEFRNCTIGDCAGKQTCSNKKWGSCIKTNSSCIENCTNGDVRTCKVGNCAGNQTCVNKTWSNCTKLVSSCNENPDEEPTCEEESGFCLSSIACSEAEGIEWDYYCPGVSICCSEDEALESCFDQGGEICNSKENCYGGRESDVTGLQFGETCCVGGGECRTPEAESDCDIAGGSCQTSCDTQEEEINEDCINSSDICCAAKGEESKTKSYLWLWILILLILILLVVLGYLYRETLKAYWITYRGNKKSPPSRGSPFLPPSSPSPFQRGIHPRRIVPVSNNSPSRTMPVRKSSGEMEEVLKKLKDMGK